MLRFDPWPKFYAFRDHAATTQYLSKVASVGKLVFRGRIKGGPKTGRMYGSHRASAPGEYPASRSGSLVSSVDSRSSTIEAEIGSNMPYSIYLRGGTRNMSRRKMSDDALKETMSRMVGKIKHTRFRHGSI